MELKLHCLSLLVLGQMDFTLGKLSVLEFLYNAFIIPIAEFRCAIAAISVSVLVQSEIKLIIDLLCQLPVPLLPKHFWFW